MYGCGRELRAIVVKAKGHKVDTYDVRKTAGESEVQLGNRYTTTKPRKS